MPNHRFEDPFYVPRPASAELLLESLEVAGNPARTIYDTRRMGKTSFLKNDVAALARERGFHVIYHSFYLAEGGTGRRL